MAPSTHGDPFDDAMVTLYSLPPEEFIDARTDLAAHARAAGDRGLAARIRALKRPTHAAWALNQLSREHPDELAALHDLGAELRQAYAELSPDRMREVSEQRRNIVSTLTRQAKALAAQRGIHLGDTAEREITESLEAALADPDAGSQLTSGQLTTALHPPPAFPFTPAAPKTPAAPARRRPPSRAPRPKAEDQPAQRKERQRRQQERQRLAEAQRAADDAEQEARSADEDLASQDERLRHLQHAADDQAARVHDLTEQLDRARNEAREGGSQLAPSPPQP